MLDIVDTADIVHTVDIPDNVESINGVDNVCSVNSAHNVHNAAAAQFAGHGDIGDIMDIVTPQPGVPPGIPWVGLTQNCLVGEPDPVWQAGCRRCSMDVLGIRLWPEVGYKRPEVRGLRGR